MPPNPELVATLLTPITGDAPSGKDLRYDPRYDKLKEARREDLDLPTRGAAVAERKLADWKTAVAIAEQLLGTETKDLQLAAWLTEALLRQNGVGGLASGLQVLRGLLADFWETFYPALDPDDLELRTGPLEWLGTRLDIAVRQCAIATGGISLLDHQTAQTLPTEDAAKSSAENKKARDEAIAQGKRPPELVLRAVTDTGKAFYKTLRADTVLAQQALDALETLSDERFGRDAPSFGKLRIALEEMLRFVEPVLAQKLVLDPDPIEEVVEEVVAGDEATATTDGAAPTAASGVLTAEPTSVADASARIGGAARFLRRQDPTNPAPYLMLRGLRWGELRAEVGRVNPTLLEAPPTAARAKLKSLALDGRWAEVLEHGETVMAASHSRGWLDLQRYTLTACAQLGSAYDAVAAGIRGELSSLLAAVPQLPEMTLMDDTPTANADTRAWLTAQGLDGTAHEANGARAHHGDGHPGRNGGALDDALRQEDATSASGGLAVSGRRFRTMAVAQSNLETRDVFALAQAELAQGRVQRAVELLVAELARERSPRGQFVRQTQVAYVMVEGGLDVVARPILERLIQTITERTLEDWESGPLVAQPMTLLCRVIDKLGGDAAQRQQLYLRVCRLDPLQAITLQPVA